MVSESYEGFLYQIKCAGHDCRGKESDNSFYLCCEPCMKFMFVIQ